MKTLQKYTAISGILFFIVTIVATVMVASTGITEQAMEMGEVDKVLTIMAANLGMVVASMWLFNLANVCMAVFTTGFVSQLADEQPWVRLAILLIILSAACFFIETTMTIGVAQGLASAYVAASGAEQAAISAGALALIFFRDATALLAGVLVAVVGVLFGVALLKTQNWSRWLAWLVLISGILGLLGGLYPFVAVLSFVRGISYMLFGLWAMIVGIKLLRS